MSKRPVKMWRWSAAVMVLLFVLGLVAFVPELVMSHVQFIPSPRSHQGFCAGGNPPLAAYHVNEQNLNDAVYSLYATKDIHKGETIAADSVREWSTLRGFTTKEEAPSLLKSQVAGRKARNEIKAAQRLDYGDIDWRWNGSIYVPDYSPRSPYPDDY